MAKGRTVSARSLTGLDKAVLQICNEISELFLSKIDDENERKELKKVYAKLNMKTRDAGLGQGGGKWQRDALTTRGITSKAPFSNRNLRWHPLVTASEAPAWAKPVESVEIIGRRGVRRLVFKVSIDDHIWDYPAKDVHTLPEKFVVLPRHWDPHNEELKNWNAEDWTRNSCVIKAEEACSWQDAIEAYAILGLTTLHYEHQVSLIETSHQVVELFDTWDYEGCDPLPTVNYPKTFQSLTSCSVCLRPLKDDLGKFRFLERPHTWIPNWARNKRGEGEDSSLQIMHIDPLSERQIQHHASNVRYGHRWCNLMMSDHNLVETLIFMEEIVRLHGPQRVPKRSRARAIKI